MKENKNEPDFKELNDRLIAEAPKGPFLAITTNLDSKDSLSENPYVNESATNKDKKEVKEFFDET